MSGSNTPVNGTNSRTFTIPSTPSSNVTRIRCLESGCTDTTFLNMALLQRSNSVQRLLLPRQIPILDHIAAHSMTSPSARGDSSPSSMNRDVTGHACTPRLYLECAEDQTRWYGFHRSADSRSGDSSRFRPQSASLADDAEAGGLAQQRTEQRHFSSIGSERMCQTPDGLVCHWAGESRRRQ
jgi:hypothetical protein